MKTKKLTDLQLIDRFKNGDQESFQELFQRYKDNVYTYIFLLVKKEHLAEDIFQDTFIKVISSLQKGKYNDNGKFVYWVIRIAHNLIIDHFRKEKQLQTVSKGDYEHKAFNSRKYAEANFEDVMIKDQISNDVKDLVELLPYDQKEVVVLRHFVGLSFKEIADHTNVSINTALGRMRYALINLRKLIEDKNLVLTQ